MGQVSVAQHPLSHPDSTWISFYRIASSPGATGWMRTRSPASHWPGRGPCFQRSGGGVISTSKPRASNSHPFDESQYKPFCFKQTLTDEPSVYTTGAHPKCSDPAPWARPCFISNTHSSVTTHVSGADRSLSDVVELWP